MTIIGSISLPRLHLSQAAVVADGQVAEPGVNVFIRAGSRSFPVGTETNCIQFGVHESVHTCSCKLDELADVTVASDKKWRDVVEGHAPLLVLAPPICPCTMYHSLVRGPRARTHHTTTDGQGPMDSKGEGKRRVRRNKEGICVCGVRMRSHAEAQSNARKAPRQRQRRSRKQKAEGNTHTTRPVLRLQQNGKTQLLQGSSALGNAPMPDKSHSHTRARGRKTNLHLHVELELYRFFLFLSLLCHVALFVFASGAGAKGERSCLMFLLCATNEQWPRAGALPFNNFGSVSVAQHQPWPLYSMSVFPDNNQPVVQCAIAFTPSSFISLPEHYTIPAPYARLEREPNSHYDSRQPIDRDQLRSIEIDGGLENQRRVPT